MARRENKGKEGKGEGKFQGTCGYCGRKGHKRKDCFKRLRDQPEGREGGKKGGKGGKAKGSSSSASSSTAPVQEVGGVAIVRAYCDAEDNDDYEENDDLWIFAIGAVEQKEVVLENCKIRVLIDSGADDHVCPPCFGSDK